MAKVQLQHWKDGAWTPNVTITTDPVKVTQSDGVELTGEELTRWLDSQPSAIVKGERVNAAEDLAGWVEGMLGSRFTYARWIAVD